MVSIFCILSIRYQRPHKYSVLIIHSFNEKNYWVREINNGIYNSFQKNKIVVEIESIYLEENKTEYDENIEIIGKVLNKYSESTPDLIITCDGEALRSLLSTAHPLTYSIPIVFSGVNYLPVYFLEDHTNITGFTTTPDYEKCYKLARQLFGRIDDIVLIAEDSPLGKMAISEAKSQFKEFPNVTYIHEMFWNYNITDTVGMKGSSVNPLDVHIERVDMMYGEMLKEVLYYKLYSVCVLPRWNPFYAQLPRVGTAPFILVNNKGLGDGQIGGYMVPAYDQGYEAATRGMEIIKGADPNELPICPSKQVPVFDWDQLQFWRIDMKKLPPGSIIPNIPMLVKYRDLLISASIIAGLLIILFGLMMVRLYKLESRNKIQVQKKLEKEQNELDITINSLNEGVVSVDTKGRILSINKAAIQLLQIGDDEQDFQGVSVWSLFDIQEKGNPYYLNDRIKNLSDSLGKQKLSDTAYLITKNKKAFSVSGSISSLYYNGCSYGSVITFHDTTDEFTQKEYLGLSMISGDIFAWHYDENTHSIVYDSSFFDTFHIKDDGTHSIHTDLFLDVIHPEDLENWKSAMVNLFKGKMSKMTRQVRFKFPGREDYEWWEYRFSSLKKSAKDSRPRLLGICMSVERFKRTEEELIRLRDEAEISDQLKGVFLSNMSHEVRTPLNAIVGFSSLLIDSDNSSEEKSEFIDIINENCRLLLKLINEILDISRIESGITFKKELCQLSLLINDLIADQSLDQYKDIDLIVQLPESPITISSDVYRLKQVLGNMLDNAYKFTKNGYVKIGYESDNSRREIILFVKDNGVGISKEDLPRIFERFYKSDDFIQGGGLGLPIAKEIIKRMSGRIEVVSELNKGTSFFIHLPWSEVLPTVGTSKIEDGIE